MPYFSASSLSVDTASRGSARSHHSYEEISSSLAMATALCLLTIKMLSGPYIKCISVKLQIPLFFFTEFEIYFWALTCNFLYFIWIMNLNLISFLSKRTFLHKLMFEMYHRLFDICIITIGFAFMHLCLSLNT